MKIATIDLGKEPLFLAPMEDVTDASFRFICKEYGADMMYTEFVSADGYADNPIELSEGIPVGLGVPQVVAGCERMGCVEAHSQDAAVLRKCQNMGDFLETGAETRSLSGCDFDEDIHGVRFGHLEGTVQIGRETIEASFDAVTPVRARMGDEIPDSKGFAAIDLLRECFDGSLRYGRIHRRKVDEIGIMSGDRYPTCFLPRLPELLHTGWVYRPRIPLELILGEDLKGPSPDLAYSLEGEMEPACNGHMSSKQRHGHRSCLGRLANGSPVCYTAIPVNRGCREAKVSASDLPAKVIFTPGYLGEQ